MPTQKPDGTRRLGFVLSSADFGRAYLADGWATRFVRELLQSYVIVLLGYSANDPPVRYLLEGLHSRTDKSPAAIYAFDSGSEDEVQVRWRDRGVSALAYINTDASYSALWDSLRAWAARADDPDTWRRTIVTTLAQVRPRTLRPHERGQVVSVIRSQRGARVFADTVPPPPAEWLCVFDRNIRYGNPREAPGSEGEVEPLPEFSLDDDPPRPASKPWRDGEVDDDLVLSRVRPGALARLGSFGGRQTAPLPDRLLDLSRWLAQLVEDPIAAWWAAGHSHLHDRVLEQIDWHLRRPDQTINGRARRIWALLVEALRYGAEEDRWYNFLHMLNRTGWTNSVLREFERITTPYLHCRRPYSSQPLPPDGNWNQLRVPEVVAFEVKFPPRNPEEFNITSEALPAVLRILCRGLQHAAGILADLETRYWQTTTFHPEEKPGEHYLDGKDRYLLRVVKLFDRLALEQPRLARIEVSIWPTADEFFFDKLRIYALMNGGLFSGHVCAEGLMALSDEGFWNSRHQRELLHTLRARWAEFSEEDRGHIEGRIVRGPRQWEGEEPEEYARRRAITSATILGWLELQGCKLSAKTQQTLPELRKADERWRPEWDATVDESHVSRGGSVAVNTDASKIKDAPLGQVVPLAVEHTRHPFAELTEYRPFDGLVTEHPFRALSALSYEARNGQYPTSFWQSALTNWPDEVPGRLRCLFAGRLVRLPQNLVFDLRYYIPRWFRTNFLKLARDSRERYWPVWDAIIDHFFAVGPEGNESGIGDASVGGRPVNRSRRTTNHSINSPMGVFAETLFDILNSLKRKKAQRIPSDIRSRLERLFDAPGYGADYAICETTRRVRWLFYIDPAWVTKVVIPFFDLHHSRSEPAWNGLLYDNRLPDAKLFGVLKPHFPKVFPHSSSWAWDDSPIRRLNEFLVVACYWNLNDKHYISYAEARSALQQATEEGREHAIWFLAHIVRDLNEWSQFGKPFVEQA
jgi:SIR2-like protein